MTTTTVLKAKVSIDNTGRILHLPAIIIEGVGLLIPHLQYLKQNKHKSKSWMDSSVRAIKLLLSYSDSNRHCFSTPQKMFEEFADALRTGTCDSNGLDSSGLRWKQRGDAKNVVNHITNFSEWLYRESGGETELLNPTRKASAQERILNLAAYHHKVNRSFLSHTFDLTEDAARVYSVSTRKDESHIADMEPPISFDEHSFKLLLNHGFRFENVNESSLEYNHYNLRNILITLLLHYGGLRTSEPFHLYIDDIMEDPDRKGNALVKVHHPIDGIAPYYFRKKNAERKSTRKDYLNQKFGIEPRWGHHKKSSRAGWKNPLLDSKIGKYFVVQWFPTEIAQYFLTLWKIYLKTQYIRPRIGHEHPFAFTNQFGGPASVSGYRKAHQAAVKKIGLKWNKEMGTTPHAHRHAYGQRLIDSGVGPLIIKKAMHHKSIESQLTYTQPSVLKIRQQLEEAEYILALKNKEISCNSVTKTLESISDNIVDKFNNLPLNDYKDVDPLELMSGQFRLLNRS
jgi:integrase